MRLPTFAPVSSLKGALSKSADTPLVLFRSATFMNESGVSVSKAYKDFLKEHPNGQLCVIHDELEGVLGKVKLRLAGKGKGHNGIRSVIQQLGTEEFARLAVGLSRPVSRESSVITKFVLGKFTQDERKVLHQEALISLVERIEHLMQST